MKNRIAIIFTITIIAVFSCTTTQKITSTLHSDAYVAFSEGEYETSLHLYRQVIDEYLQQQTLVPDTIFRNAGLSAFALGEKGLALEFLENVRHSELANENTHYALALLYKETDNLSRELTALEYYVEQFPDGIHIAEMKERLFQAWVESRNYENASELWPQIRDNARNKEHLLNDYFTLITALEKEDELYYTARELLALNSTHPQALFFLGRYYFDKAEQRYQAEMSAYENNRTNRQYARLLQGFEVLNEDFRTSLDFFLKLYQNDPQPRYARYLGNIYTRFNDKEKAEYYYNRARS